MMVPTDLSSLCHYISPREQLTSVPRRLAVTNACQYHARAPLQGNRVLLKQTSGPRPPAQTGQSMQQSAMNCHLCLAAVVCCCSLLSAHLPEKC